MRNKAFLFLLVISLSVASGTSRAAQQYRAALPGYRYEFPRDNFNHTDFQTEWWYYTGNLKTADGRRFGFELTFFRAAVARNHPKDADWGVEDLYIAHLALSDIGGQKFYHTERVNRAGPGIAGVDEGTGQIWNGNWQIHWNGNSQTLEAACDPFTLEFMLDSTKPPVIHGVNGVSQKAAGPGHASHYISLTRLATTGSITLNGATYKVTGTSWMDHEFFTNQLDANQIGWNWISIQLNDNTELMLFRMRRRDGSLDPYSAGTYLDAHGNSTHLTVKDFSFEPLGEIWQSPETHARYPIHWSISVPSLGLALDATTPLKPQEITGKNAIVPTYWEGAIDLSGTCAGKKTSGVGYLEMTGYDKDVKFGP